MTIKVELLSRSGRAQPCTIAHAGADACYWPLAEIEALERATGVIAFSERIPLKTSRSAHTGRRAYFLTRSAKQLMSAYPINGWDTRGRKPSDPVERFTVPLFSKSLIDLNWQSPVGSANKIRYF